MGVKIFRGDNWERIWNGVISRGDIMNLDGEGDIELIGYLIRHAPPECSKSMLEYARDRYGMDEMPGTPSNIDVPDDIRYEEYLVLREQVVREDDYGVLEDAALNRQNYDMAAFAFCRLTGYRFPPDLCDAYSYRTYACDIFPGMTAENIREFCRKIIMKGDRFLNVAEECLCHQKGPNQ